MTTYPEIRGLSLLQPWAQFMADGLKWVETRSWSTRYRGLVLIHASKSKAGLYECPAEALTYARQAGYPYVLLPHAAVVAVGVLSDVRPTDQSENFIHLKPRELSMGNYAPGRFGWMFSYLWKLPKPVKAKGSLGLWIPEQVVLNDVKRQMRYAGIELNNWPRGTA